ncbi:unnamed protein product [Closterium sp. NIES-53]
MLFETVRVSPDELHLPFEAGRSLECDMHLTNVTSHTILAKARSPLARPLLTSSRSPSLSLVPPRPPSFPLALPRFPSRPSLSLSMRHASHQRHLTHRPRQGTLPRTSPCSRALPRSLALSRALPHSPALSRALPRSPALSPALSRALSNSCSLLSCATVCVQAAALCSAPYALLLHTE